MSQEELRPSILDQEHLRLLSLGYLVSACLSGLFSLIGLMYAFMGLFIGTAFTRANFPPGQAPPPEFFGLFFGLFGLAMFGALVILGVLKFVAYRRLKERRSRVFCMVIAGLSCLSIPYGTLLGISTFIVLSRPAVMKLFETTRTTTSF